MREVRPHVLVIDDAPVMLELMRDLLEEEGFRVSTRFSLPPDLHDLRPNLLVLDSFSAGQTQGWALLASLRGHPDTRDLPIILCSDDTAALGGQVAALDVALVGRPFDIDEFLTLVRSVLATAIAA